MGSSEYWTAPALAAGLLDLPTSVPRQPLGRVMRRRGAILQGLRLAFGRAAAPLVDRLP
jgi:hypothetical protein